MFFYRYFFYFLGNNISITGEAGEDKLVNYFTIWRLWPMSWRGEIRLPAGPPGDQPPGYIYKALRANTARRALYPSSGIQARADEGGRH
jgi:hypothetical protein